MSGGAYLIASALIAVLTERFVLDRCLGRTRLFAVSTDIRGALAGAVVTAVLLTAGTAVTWLIVAVALVPLRAVYCSATVLIAVICGLAVPGAQPRLPAGGSDRFVAGFLDGCSADA
jgi:Na+-translocating ferredoxin:NAD+ oxidoreductase RnfA subunit